MLVKICGIQSLEAALAAQNYGADLIGFVFTASKRQIEVAKAVRITAALQRIGKVGVFVNQPLAQVREIAERCRLDLIQLHGDESPEYCRSLQLPIIKAIRLDSDFSPAKLDAYADVDWLLFDSF